MIDASGPQMSYEVGAPSGAENEAIAEETLDAVPLSTTPPATVVSEDQGICEVAVASLRQGPRVRSDGVDESYAKLLASVVTPLPPIVVDSQTMVVLDGVHRLRAVVLRGETYIRARYVSGSEPELLIVAIQANASHGKPLSLTDRKDAAGRLLSLAPDMSDRAVAGICGISPTTVGFLRSSMATNEQLNSRRGRDGRVRGPRKFEKQPAERSEAGSPRLEAATRRDLGGPFQSPGRTRLPIARRDSADAPNRPVGSRPLLIDAAFHASADLEQFATWFDGHRITGQEVTPALSLIPKSRLYEVSTEARSRASFWQEMAGQLERIARGGASQG
jgi:ParB-like chromosome segregation protein Spo0J